MDSEATTIFLSPTQCSVHTLMLSCRVDTVWRKGLRVNSHFSLREGKGSVRTGKPCRTNNSTVKKSRRYAKKKNNSYRQSSSQKKKKKKTLIDTNAVQLLSNTYSLVSPYPEENNLFLTHGVRDRC